MCDCDECKAAKNVKVSEQIMDRIMGLSIGLVYYGLASGNDLVQAVFASEFNVNEEGAAEQVTAAFIQLDATTKADAVRVIHRALLESSQSDMIASILDTLTGTDDTEDDNNLQN